jgi:hypothetical protein
VANLPAEFKLSILQRLGDAVDEGEFPSLLQAFKTFQKNGIASVSGGQTILSASGGGYSTTFGVPGAFSPQELYSLWAELRRIHAAVLADLVAVGNTAPDHATIYARMEADDAFQRVISTQGDYSLMRL